MVSIRDSITELEKLHDLQVALFECYRAAVGDMKQYAVEIDDQITPAHRQHLAAIQSDLSAQMNLDGLTANRSLLRNELRDYRDRAAEFLNGLRRDLSEKADALQAIVAAMVSADGDHEERLNNALAGLRKVAGSPPAAPVMAALKEASDQIEASIEEVKRQNQLTVSQFMFEISTLHKRIEALESAGRKDVLTGLYSRVEMEARLAAEIDQHKTFSLLLLKVCNLPIVQRQFGTAVRSDVISAFAKRMGACLPPDAVVGRWSEDQFLALLTVGKLDAMGLAKRLTQHVSGTYVCMENGKPQKPSLSVNVAVIDHPAGGTHESLIERINHL